MIPEAYPRLPQRFKIERFAAIFTSFGPVTIVTKLTISDVCGSPGYGSEIHRPTDLDL